MLFISFINISSAKAAPYLIDKKLNDSITLKAKKLKQLYLLATATSQDMRNIYTEKFFNEFPDSFKELNSLYGYENDTPSILYYEAENHIIKLFNNINTINDTLYYKKVINIAIGGHWDADAINYFQHGLNDRAEKKPELIVYLLKQMEIKAIKSFWYFYFDGPHPKEQISDSLKKIKSIDIGIYNVMIEMHNKVLADFRE